jgi:hypothetical protein
LFSARASTMLYPHQVEGVRWLWSLYRLNRGGILADDMGLGGWVGGRVPPCWRTQLPGGRSGGCSHPRLLALSLRPCRSSTAWHCWLAATSLPAQAACRQDHPVRRVPVGPD